jgi:hypothetical protein
MAARVDAAMNRALPIRNFGYFPVALLLVVSGLTIPAPVHASAVFVDGTLPGDPAAAGASSVSMLGPLSPQALSSSPSSLVLYDGTTLYSAVSFTRIEINLASPGPVRVSLTDLVFPEAAGILSFALVRDGQVLGTLGTPGTLDVAVGGPGKLFAYTFAVASPGGGVASYHLSIEQPIPLPASLWLLLSGATWAGWIGRRNRSRNVRRAASA